MKHVLGFSNIHSKIITKYDVNNAFDITKQMKELPPKFPEYSIMYKIR